MLRYIAMIYFKLIEIYISLMFVFLLLVLLDTSNGMAYRFTILNNSKYIYERVILFDYNRDVELNIFMIYLYKCNIILRT